MTDSSTVDNALVPERHPQHDLFLCDVQDAVLKDIMPQMEHPFYSLSKKPDTAIREYKGAKGQWLKVIPSVQGLATIYDKDILIYCISAIMKELQAGNEVSPRVRINSRALLQFTNRGTSGRDYLALQEAIERLAGTVISTNIVTGDIEQTDVFHLIEKGTIRRQHGLDGRLIACEVELSPWVFNAIKHKEVLTLHRDYFRLRKPLERRIYEIARKFCGQQAEWKISLELLYAKSGSRGDVKEFRRVVRELAKSNRHFPDYYVHFDADDDMVIFNNRDTMHQRDDGAKYAGGMLKFETYSEVKNVVGRWSVDHVEQEWRRWVYDHDMQQHIKNPDAHFISFATTWFKKRGEPR